MPARKRKSLRPVDEFSFNKPIDGSSLPYLTDGLVYSRYSRLFDDDNEIIEGPNGNKQVVFREYYDELPEPHEYSITVPKETYQQVAQLLKDHSEVDTDDTDWTKPTLERATIGFSLYVLEKEWDNEPKGGHEQDMFRELSELNLLLEDCGYNGFTNDSMNLKEFTDAIISVRKTTGKNRNEIQKIKFFTKERSRNGKTSFVVENPLLVHIINLTTRLAIVEHDRVTKDNYLSDRHNKQNHARTLIRLTEEHLSFRTLKTQYELVYSLMETKGFSLNSKKRFDNNIYDTIRKLGYG